ncbi:MAG: leucine-rich repeat domain-containing protein [Prevotellaceae bacterium]|jgi:hypothetical protein|nr:leucine-rich repeat domain-containing protein [Prevotellaceae bacterium]
MDKSLIINKLRIMTKPTRTVIMLAAAALPGTGAQAQPATVASGACGDNLTWTLTGDSVLTIRGTGEMYSFGGESMPPWYDYGDQIKAVVIGDSVTDICGEAFSRCSALNSVNIPSSVTDISKHSFYHCKELSAITSLRTQPQPISDVFPEMDMRYCTLYVPVGSVAAYREAGGWRDFVNIEPIPATAAGADTLVVWWT